MLLNALNPFHDYSTNHDIAILTIQANLQAVNIHLITIVAHLDVNSLQLAFFVLNLKP